MNCIKNMLLLVKEIKSKTELELGENINILRYNLGALDSMEDELKACLEKEIKLLRRDDMINDTSIIKTNLREVRKKKSEQIRQSRRVES